MQALALFTAPRRGLFALLNEECIFPKGSDATFTIKLFKEHSGEETAPSPSGARPPFTILPLLPCAHASRIIPPAHADHAERRHASQRTRSWRGRPAPPTSRPTAASAWFTTRARSAATSLWVLLPPVGAYTPSPPPASLAKVVYSCRDFLLKNKDPLSEDLQARRFPFDPRPIPPTPRVHTLLPHTRMHLHALPLFQVLLRSSTDPMLASLFAPAGGGGGGGGSTPGGRRGGRGGSKFRGVVLAFAADLDELLRLVTASHT